MNSYESYESCFICRDKDEIHVTRSTEPHYIVQYLCCNQTTCKECLLKLFQVRNRKCPYCRKILTCEQLKKIK